MKIRTGRPKVENPKNLNITVRFDAETFDRLNEYCSNNKVTKAEATRKGVELLLEQNEGKEERRGNND